MDTSTGSRPAGRPGLAKYITLVVLVGAAVGVAGGLLSQPLGISPPVLWVLLWAMVGPMLTLTAMRARGGEARSPAVAGARARVVLLDARATGRRLVQTVLPLAGTLMAVSAVSHLVSADSSAGAWAWTALVVGSAFILAGVLYPIAWEVSYKGHRIRFDNYPCLAERLFIDGTLRDRGGIGVQMTLAGTIPDGDGAGERIVATSVAGILSFSCRIVAETIARA